MQPSGETPAKSVPAPGLRRVMGFPDVVLFFITAGVNLQWVATASAAGPSAISVWFIAFATMAIPLAFAIVEMSSRYPQEGGMYVWSKRAFGDFAAFIRLGPAREFTPASLTPGLDVKNLIFWSSIAFALTGLEAASFMGEEIRDARRTIPRAIFTAVPLITLIYALGTLCVLVALPAGRLSGLEGVIDAIDAAAGRLGLPAVTPVAAFLITLSALGSVGAWLASVARLPFVAGLDHFLPESFGRIHPKWRTPHVALLSLAVTIVICIFLGQAGTTVRGAYEVLVSMTVICTLIPFLFLFASLIRLQREVAGPDVIRVPGGRPVAVLAGVVGFTTTALSIVLAFFPAAAEPHKALAVAKIVGLTVLSTGSGVVVYAVGRWRQRRAPGGQRGPAGPFG